MGINKKRFLDNNFSFFSRPDLFEYKPLLRNSARGNLEHAFNVANMHLGVPMLLDPEGSYRRSSRGVCVTKVTLCSL